MLFGGVFADDQEGVAGEEAALAVGDYVAFAAADHHHEVPFRKGYLAEGVEIGRASCRERV